MNSSSNRSRGTRGRTGGTDRGGIRKRGATPRVDRDGDMDMAASGTSAGKGRIRSSRGVTPGRSSRRPGEKEKTIDALQKAIFSSSSSQANIRHGRGIADGALRRNLTQIKVSGWKNSKAASNPDGGVVSLVAFLEKKYAPPDQNATAPGRFKITKVCAISRSRSRSRSYRHTLQHYSSALSPFSCQLERCFFSLRPSRHSTNAIELLQRISVSKVNYALLTFSSRGLKATA